jgi:hypothetical protein
MDCPICKSEMTKTEYFNKIFNEFNCYCSSCNSYHIVKEKDTSEYYSKEYHKRFSYNNSLSKIINRLSLVSNRTMSRFLFLEKYANVRTNMNFLEIGGTYGEFYNISYRRVKPSSYTIIEPDPKFNRVKKSLSFVNSLFEGIHILDYKETDVILMFHVFEHIFDINRFLDDISKIKPFTFYFEVPNCENETVKLDSLINNPHYHHFSKKSLEILFDHHHFTPIKLEVIEPQSYHPYKKIGIMKRYKRRFSEKNEIFDESGIYIRGIYQI